MSDTDRLNADIVPDNDTTQVKISSKSNPKSVFSKDETSSLGTDGSYYEQGRKKHNESVTRKDKDIHQIYCWAPRHLLYIHITEERKNVLIT